MTGSATWAQENARYLAGAVAAVRAQLDRHARPDESSVVRPEPERHEESRSVWRAFGRRQIAAPGTSSVTPASSAPGPSASPASGPTFPLASAEAPPALVTLVQRLNLTSFERDILVLCAAMELDTHFASLCARAQDPPRPYPTFSLALAVLENPAWEALSPDHPLRYWRLIEIVQTDAQQPLTSSALRADERIVSYLRGLNYVDDRLAPSLWPFESPERIDVPSWQQTTEDAIVSPLKEWPKDRKLPVVQLAGRDTATKQMIAAAVAAQLGLRVFRMHVNMLPANPTEMEAFARLWHRESLLLPGSLYLEGEPSGGESSSVQPVQNFLSRLNTLVFLEAQDVWPALGQPTMLVEVERRPAAEQKSAWQAAIGENADDTPALLAAQFDLSLPAIREIARQAMADKPENLRDRLWNGALRATQPRLNALAARIDAHASWEDLVLPTPEMKLLRQIAAQVSQRTTVYDDWGFRDKSSRGLGITALFSGPSGTGKTLAVEILAADLKLSLHRIDLATVVSKYIGETEKNLRKLFDAAEDGGTVLFFDEADALFGKRSEVKDSHDRYANIEINYLLQRMEAYRGLAILATNMKSALDDAFVRRLRFIVNFPFPTAADRKLIWQKVFPDRVPRSGLDYERLSKLNVTGGNVRNIALNAAFLAARSGSSVTMPLVLEAARTEFRKLERPIIESDFACQGAA